MEGIVWTKLMMNLNGAIMALTGHPVKKFFQNRILRQIGSAGIREADMVVRKSGVKPASVGLITPFLLLNTLLLPDWIFSILIGFIIKIDPNAKTSIHVDLDAGKKTEIDYLNGEIVSLGNKLGIPTPINSKIVQLVKEAEEKKISTLTPKELLFQVGLKESSGSFSKYLMIFSVVLAIFAWKYFY